MTAVDESRGSLLELVASLRADLQKRPGASYNIEARSVRKAAPRVLEHSLAKTSLPRVQNLTYDDCVAVFRVASNLREKLTKAAAGATWRWEKVFPSSTCA